MSFSFSGLLAAAETVLTDVQVGETAITPVVAAIPGAGPILAGAEAATAAALALIKAGQGIASSGTPLITEIETIFDGLFHITHTPQAIVLTPKTTAGTKPA